MIFFHFFFHRCRYISKPSLDTDRPWECLLTLAFRVYSRCKIELPIWSVEEIGECMTLGKIVALKPKNFKRFNVRYKYSVIYAETKKHVYFDKTKGYRYTLIQFHV